MNPCAPGIQNPTVCQLSYPVCGLKIATSPCSKCRPAPCSGCKACTIMGSRLHGRRGVYICVRVRVQLLDTSQMTKDQKEQVLDLGFRTSLGLECFQYSPGPGCIYHYINCGFSWWWRKFRLQIKFPNTWWALLPFERACGCTLPASVAKDS